MTNRRGHKESLLYWWHRVRQPHGQYNYAVELYWDKQRINWTLGTDNHERAAARARAMYLYLAAHGLEALKRKYRP